VVVEEAAPIGMMGMSAHPIHVLLRGRGDI
jgi:hypothetical protein